MLLCAFVTGTILKQAVRLLEVVLDTPAFDSRFDLFYVDEPVLVQAFYPSACR